MRFIAPFLALIVAVATAQQNAINIPPGGLQVKANVPTTITWTNPSSGTITIKLQQGSGVTPDSGLTLITGILASDETATFTIPASDVNSAQYNFEIIDDSDPYNYNFSPGFTVAGATGTGTMTPGTLGATEAAATTAAAASSALPSFEASTTTLRRTTTLSSQSSAAASSNAPFSEPTSIVNNNGAGSLQMQGGLLAMIVGALAAF